MRPAGRYGARVAKVRIRSGGPRILGVTVNNVRRCAGFLGVTSIDRCEFGISWNGDLGRCGSVVGNTVQITIDAEAIQD